MAQRRMILKGLGYSRKFHALNAECWKLGDFAQALLPLIVVHADDFGGAKGDASEDIRVHSAMLTYLTKIAYQGWRIVHAAAV
jgi:hypothetical protein